MTTLSSADPESEAETPAEGPKCPVCNRPRVAEFRPFCSRRCRDVDLARWMSGAYAIAGEEGEIDDKL